MNGFGGSWRGVCGWLLAGLLLSVSVPAQQPTADEIYAIRMKMLSPDTDFSYDFHDLDLRRVGED